MKVSEYLTTFLVREGVKHVFGIPGGYVISLVSEISNSGQVEFVLSSHEGGAAYMAHGYAQATRKFGVVMTTAGPAALNAITGLAQAASDGDTVLLIHGGLPASKLHLGGLQDTHTFQCNIAEVLKGLTVCQKNVVNVKSFLEDFRDVQAHLVQAKALPRSGPVHLQVACDTLNHPIPELVAERPQPAFAFDALEYRPSSGRSLEADVEQAARILREAKRPLLFLGNGVYQAQAEDAVKRLANMLRIPIITTAKGVACVDSASELLLGQYSIFPHLRPAKWLESGEVDVILALGTAFGEYGSNSFNRHLKRPHIIHVDKNPHVFGRGIGLNVEPERRTYLEQELKSFVQGLTARISDQRELYRHLDQTAAIRAFRQTYPSNFGRIQETLQDDTKLTGQRVFRELSQALAHLPKVNLVTDTGSSKLYASHYVDYRPGWRLFQPGGFDTMGYGVSAAIGVTFGARDMEGEDAGLTVCAVGDGSLYMNNELSCAASSVDTSLLIFVLNDYRLATVYQGCAVVNEQQLRKELEFTQHVDLKKYVEALGLECVVVDRPGQISRELIESLKARKRPIVVDCRIDRTVLGPGFERYNEVRAMMGRNALTASQMSELISDPSELKSVAPKPLRNTVYLYGDIRDVFIGCIEPQSLLNADHYVERDMRFGIGVCSFSDDVADIADSCFIDGRFFIKHTEEGLKRSGVINSQFGLKQRLLDKPVHAHVEYVAPYSLGMKELRHYDMKYWFGSDAIFGAKKRPTMQDMLISFTGGIRAEDGSDNPRMIGEAERAVGFIGVCEFESWWGTSLQHAPIEGRDILKDIDYFARPGRDYGKRMAVVVGFAQRAILEEPGSEQRELLDRMFYENPHDRAKGGARDSERSDNVFWIASHTHGVLLNEDDNVFCFSDEDQPATKSDEAIEAFLRRLQTDEAMRNQFIDHVFSKNFVDSSHVIPDSILRRYMFMQFEIENVVVRGKYDNDLAFDLKQRVVKG
jgi:acetolactate synthase-1/2/3 large subunit